MEILENVCNKNIENIIKNIFSEKLLPNAKTNCLKSANLLL